jgi:ceramide glucosyltransferase
MSLAVGLAGVAGLAVGAGTYVASAATLLRLRRSQRRRRGSPAAAAYTPPVSILKPLRGLDEGLEQNLESFFRLDYPTSAFEIVFSFASASDPAYAPARRVADRHPEVESTFVFDEREPGGNAKVNRLSAAMRYAKHRYVLFSDGNVRVQPGFLRRAVSWFQDPRVGLVSNLFRASGAASLGSRIEALYLNGCLMPGTAFIADVLGQPCVVGKSILVSRRALESIGGIGSLRDYLAEDFVLGREIRRAGYRVVLSSDVLDTVEVRKSLRTVWERHRRWSIMRRRLGGQLYVGEALVSALPWLVLALSTRSAPIRIAAAALLGARWGAEVAVIHEWGQKIDWRDVVLLPARDLFAAGVFWAGLLGRTLAWRGRPLVVGPDTRILRESA